MGQAPTRSQRPAIIAMIVIILVLLGALGYVYVQFSNQVSDKSSQIGQLQSQLADKNSQIGQLQSQVGQLQSQVSTSSAVSLYGVFAFQTSGCGGFFGGNCVYTIGGPFANFGSNTANSATVTFTFYSGQGHTGQVLCQTTVILGNVAGRTVAELPSTKCNSNYSTQYQSWTWNFANQ